MVPSLREAGKKGKNLPVEVKIVGMLVVMLGALYVFQLISTPSFLKSQVSGVTGFVVSDTDQAAAQSPQKAEEPAATTTTATSTEESEEKAVKPASTSPTQPVKIISPPKGSVQSPGFKVNVEVSEPVLTCYYRTDDSGQLTWDRRTKPCSLQIQLKPEHCNTIGSNTCRFYAEAADGNGNIIGSDTAYYGIQ